MSETKAPTLPILLVDDEPEVLRSYELNLRYHGYKHTVALQDSREAPSRLANERFSLVVLDLCMPHLSGEELLKIIAEKHAGLPVIVVTGINEVETAVRCMRAGALHFLLKPVDRSRLLETVDAVLHGTDSAAASAGAARTGKPPSQAAGKALGEPEFMAADPAMAAVLKRLRAISVTQEPALILGETGVGKELAARQVHKLSGRKGEFVALNAAGLDDAFFSDTLFGHSKGAYTNAQTSRTGLIDVAAEGSLFLDEIGDLSFASQLKLLRLIQEREYYPLGSDSPRPLRARIITATNRTAAELMDPALFRRDLFFRLRTHTITIPPLRERPLDIPLLVQHFLQRASQELSTPPVRVTPDFIELLERYAFPGNVREMEAMLYNAVALHSAERHVSETDVLDSEPLVEWMTTAPEAAPNQFIVQHPSSECGFGVELKADGTFPTLKQAQERVIQEALRRCGNNQAKAARLLGISRQALNRRLNTAR